MSFDSNVNTHTSAMGVPLSFRNTHNTISTNSASWDCPCVIWHPQSKYKKAVLLMRSSFVVNSISVWLHAGVQWAICNLHPHADFYPDVILHISQWLTAFTGTLATFLNSRRQILYSQLSLRFLLGYNQTVIPICLSTFLSQHYSEKTDKHLAWIIDEQHRH